MYYLFLKFYNHISTGNAKSQLFFAYSFTPFTIMLLLIDSKFVASNYVDFRPLVNIIAFGYFVAMLSAANTRLRKLMIIMVPLSFLGEILFCNLLDLYDYRENQIPIYVPFGHAIVYGSGYMLADHLTKFDDIAKKLFLTFFIIIFAIAGLYFGDHLTLILSLFFFWSLRRKNWQPLYYYIAIYVLVIVFAGTFFGVWAWEQYAFGYIATLSPPVGAVYLYLGGDGLLLRIVNFMEKNNILKPKTISESASKQDPKDR